MKKCILLMSIILLSCENSKKPCRLTIVNGNGWSRGCSEIQCDSFQMQGTKKAIIWVNRTKMQIEGEVIYPHIN